MLNRMLDAGSPSLKTDDVQLPVPANTKPDEIADGATLSVPMEVHTEEEFMTELIGGYLELFITLFNNILYKCSGYPAEAYFFADMYDRQVPVSITSASKS